MIVNDFETGTELGHETSCVSSMSDTAHISGPVVAMYWTKFLSHNFRTYFNSLLLCRITRGRFDWVIIGGELLPNFFNSGVL
jgi:hypothetical protein